MKWLERPWNNHPMQTCPNKSSRQGASIDSIFLHYTAGGSHDGAVAWFMNPAAKASAHFVVGRAGEIIQVVPLDERAWHAGEGRFPVGGQIVQVAVDRSAVGIEIVNHGLLSQHDGQFFYHLGEQEKPYDITKYGKPVEATLDFGDNTKSQDVHGFWAPYPEKQVDAVVQLCGALIDEFNIPLQRIVGHEDVAFPQGRKTDPGPAWSWMGFMELLVGRNAIKQCLNGVLPPDIWGLHKTVK